MRISEPMIKYLLDHIDKNDIGFFTQLLNTIAKVYSLNYLKYYLNTNFSITFKN